MELGGGGGGGLCRDPDTKIINGAQYMTLVLNNSCCIDCGSTHLRVISSESGGWEFR